LGRKLVLLDALYAFPIIGVGFARFFLVYLDRGLDHLL
jgi:hypothetical protein